MISVVIPAHNEERYLPKTLRSLKKQDYKGEYEVIVVDNASTDGTALVAQKYGAKVVYEPHKGLTWARQKGFEVSRGDIIACLDADTIASPSWLRLLEEAFKRNPKVAAVTGPLFTYDIKDKGTKALINTLVLVGHLTEIALKKMLNKDMIFGGNSAVRKTALLKIGGWNKKIEFLGEDFDLACRLAKIGKIKYLPSLVAYTSIRRFSREGFIKTLWTYEMNALWMLIFNRPLKESDNVQKLYESLKLNFNNLKRAIEKDEEL